MEVGQDDGVGGRNEKFIDTGSSNEHAVGKQQKTDDEPDGDSVIMHRFTKR
jgi:hypothetical protein